MPSLPISRRTTHRLLKLASLGLAGLLSGCNISSDHSADVSFKPISTETEFTPYQDLPENIDAVQTPTLHHSPSARRLQISSVGYPHHSGQ